MILAAGEGAHLKAKKSKAASDLAKQRWAGMTKEERSEYASKIAKQRKQPKKPGPRCPCKKRVLKTAWAQGFSCCRKAGKTEVAIDRARAKAKKLYSEQ